MHVRFEKTHVDIQLADKDLMRLKEVLNVLADKTPYYEGTILETFRKVIHRYEELNIKKHLDINLGK